MHTTQIHTILVKYKLLNQFLRVFASVSWGQIPVLNLQRINYHCRTEARHMHTAAVTKEVGSVGISEPSDIFNCIP